MLYISTSVLLYRIELKKASLITAFLDCCREYTYTARGPEAGPARSGGHKKSAIVQKLILYACGRNNYAYDGEEGLHGNDFIYKNKLVPMRVEKPRLFVIDSFPVYSAPITM